MKIEEKLNEVWRSVAICSETEVTNGSSELKNGFNAFRYLKEGQPVPDIPVSIPEEKTPMPETINPITTKIEFLILLVSLLNV